jgi:hypothetical protein
MTFRKAAGLIFLLVVISTNGAALDSTIAESCPSGYEEVISMQAPDETFSNPGPPGLYKYNVCVSGIIESEIKSQCRSTPAFYLSSRSTHAHFSDSKGYNLEVCTGKMITRTRDSCLANQTALFAVSKPINGYGRHVAGVSGGTADVYDQVVCGFYAPPSNVSYSLEFNLSSSDDIYFDDEQKTGEFTTSTLVEFPYLVSESSSYVSGLVADSYVQASRGLEGKNVLKMKREAGKDGVIIPFTTGSHQTIEDQQESILENEFESQLASSFSYFIPSSPTVRVVLATNVDMFSNLSIGKGTHNIEIEKIGENEIRISKQ